MSEPIAVTRLMEATKLAKQLERACDAEQGIVARFPALGAPWDPEIANYEWSIARLTAARDKLIGERNADPDFSKWSIRITRITNLRADLTAKLKELAYSLVDEKALFPSGKKSQVLTDRVTLKSQLPTKPVVVDEYAFVCAAEQDQILGLICKKLTVVLEGGAALLWWQKREDKEVGLEMPGAKILNIKVKEAKK